MKRAYPAVALLNAAGRMVDIAMTEDRLRNLDGCDTIVCCQAILPPDRKPSRLGRAAQARRAAGSPRALGRLSASIAEWTEIRAEILERDGLRCVACGSSTRPLQIHHVEKASAGGTDFDHDLLVTLCGGPGGCHDKVDAPFATGRLVILPLGGGAFDCRLVTKPSKFSPDPVAP